MPPAPPSPPPAEELRILYLDKRLSRRDLAAHYGVAPWTVKAWLHAAGIRRPPSWATTVPAEQLRQLYLDQGLTAAQIANRQHVSTSQVYQALRRHHLRRDTPGPRPIPPPPTAELRCLYVQQRQNLEQLASRYSVSPWTVRRWLRTAGVRRQRPRGHPWATTVSVDLLRELYLDQGLTMRQIAARQQVSEGVVWQALNYHQIPRRPASRQPKPTPDAAMLRRFYLQERWSIRQLASRYRVSYATMQQRLVKAGVPLRQPGGYARWHRHQP